MTKRNTKVGTVFADAQTAMPFVVEQGRNIEARIYARRYPTMNYGIVVPVVTEGAEWAIGTMFQTVDTTGVSKFISGAANDIPYAGATRDQHTHDYAMIGAGWEWNFEEVQQAAFYGLDLNATKALAAAQANRENLYNIAMVGTTEKNWTGFTNDAGVSRVDAATVSAHTGWRHKDIDDILVDINELGFGAIRSATNEVEYADTIALPPDEFRYLASTRVGAGDGAMTMLEMIRLNNVYTAESSAPLAIIPVRALATASQDGGGRMVVYRRDPEVLRFHLPMPPRIIGVHQKSLMGYEDGEIARTGGTEVRLPGAMVYIDEIDE